MNILASRNRDSGAVETYIPDTETAFDWLKEIESMSTLRGVSRLYIGEISCILDNCQSVS